MTTYDIRVIGVILLLTFAVFALLGLLTLGGVSVGALWFMPVGWWVGAMMVWGYTKYTGR